MDKKEFATKKGEVLELAELLAGVEDEAEFVSLLPKEAAPFFKKDEGRILGQSRQIAGLLRAIAHYRHGSNEAYKAAIELEGARSHFANMMLAICLYYPHRVTEEGWHKLERRTLQMQAFRCLQKYFEGWVAGGDWMAPVRMRNSGLPLCHVQVDMLEYMAGFRRFGEAEQCIRIAGNTEPPQVELGALPISFC